MIQKTTHKLIDNLNSAKFCVIGNGSWATALVKLMLNKIDNVDWFIRKPDNIEFINRYGHNPNYLSSIQFDANKLHMTSDISEAINNADVVVIATPSAFLKGVLSKLTVSLNNKFIVSAVKGIIPDSNETVAEFFNHQYNIPYSKLGIISGPCHAEEVALERLSYLTFSCKQKQLSETMARFFECDYLRVIASTDIYGVEYAAVLKNIYAIAAGICNGLGYGDNFMAVLISNAFEEMKRFLNTSFPSHRLTTKSAYLGDLLVTCYSQFSRNRTFGGMLGKGYSVKAIQTEMNMVAEGHYASKCMHEINKKYKVNMPIADAVYRIIYDNAPANTTIKALTEVLA